MVEVKWKLVDKVYLERSKPSNAAQIESWVNFLEQLGVERNLAITKRTLALTQEELVGSNSVSREWLILIF